MKRTAVIVLGLATFVAAVLLPPFIAAAVFLPPFVPNSGPSDSTVTVAPIATPAGLVLADGAWIAGVMVPAGSYRTLSTNNGCGWDVTDPTGKVVLDSGSGTGEFVLTVTDGQVFASRDCGAWQYIGAASQ